MALPPSSIDSIVKNIIRKAMEFFGIVGNDISSLKVPRSSGWRTVRRNHLKAYPNCIVCGSTMNVVPHHVVPFHVDPLMELDPENLVTLCESPSFNCHLFFGHLKRWDRHNPDILKDAEEWRRKLGLDH